MANCLTRGLQTRGKAPKTLTITVSRVLTNLSNKGLAISWWPSEQYATVASTSWSVRLRILYWPLQQTATTASLSILKYLLGKTSNAQQRVRRILWKQQTASKYTNVIWLSTKCFSSFMLSSPVTVLRGRLSGWAIIFWAHASTLHCITIVPYDHYHHHHLNCCFPGEPWFLPLLVQEENLWG